MTDRQRAAVIGEAETWLGTPYHHMGRVKGVGCDCLTLIAEVYERAEIVGHVEIPYYPPDWHLHRGVERYMNGLANRDSSRPIVSSWGVYDDSSHNL